MKMSELLYLTDSYIKEFDCKVTETNEEDNAVVIDKTAFYPGGGGQPNDTGILTDGTTTYNVNKVKKKDNKIYHYIEGSLPQVNQTLKGIINWENRYQLMRTHTAMHILSGVVWRDYQAQVTGANMEPLSARMDFEFENFNENLIKEIEEKINKEVKIGRDISVKILSREEAFQIPDLIRTKINLLPEGIQEVRTVNIEGLDLQADGGTHVKNTEEVGKIKIVKYKSKGVINKRVYLELEN